MHIKNVFDDLHGATDTTNDFSNTDNTAALFSYNLRLQEFNMGDLYPTFRDFINIATAINMSNLRKLDVNNSNKLDDNALDAVINLLEHINLEMLDISAIKLENVTNVVKIATAMQKSSNLTKISIWCDGLTNDAADAIAAILPHNSNRD